MSSTISRLYAGLAVAGLVCLAAAPAVAQRPDFTGVWTTYRSGDAPGGRNADGPAPALRPEAQAKVEVYRGAIENTNFSPGAYCVGTGMPGSMLGSGGYPMEIVQRPEQINVVYEAHNEMRRIYFGDRVVDNQEEVWPERNGYSVGRWEGDTLVVETRRLVEQVDQRYPHSAEAHIVERYRMGTENGLRVITATLTMTDPVFLTEPFTTEKKWQEVPNGRLMNYDCTEPTWLDIVDALMSGETPDVEYN